MTPEPDPTVLALRHPRGAQVPLAATAALPPMAATLGGS
jgi:hypothetical protein